MKRLIPRIAPKYLLLIAGLVWAIAGANIVRIGVNDFIVSWQNHMSYIIYSCIIYILFAVVIFGRLVKKHYIRISKISANKVPFYKFFDKKSYLIMVFMITFGLTLRYSHILPPIAIGIMYCAIGSAMITASILLFIIYLVYSNRIKNNTYHYYTDNVKINKDSEKSL